MKVWICVSCVVLYFVWNQFVEVLKLVANLLLAMVFFEVLSNRQSLYESVHRKETDLERKLRNEKRVLEYLEKAKSKTETIDTVKQLNVVWGLPEQVCLVMNDLINLIVRDFIYFWMDNFTKNREFGINVKNLLTDIFGALGNKLQGIAPQTAIQLVEDSIQLVHVHLCIFREATVLVKKNDNVDTRNEVIRQYFADHQFLHPACTGAPNVEEVYLNGIAVEILQELKSDFCMTNNFFVRTFKVLLREVLAGAILKPILGFAEPYYINLLIIQMMNTKVDENNTHPEHASKMKDTNGKKYQANPKRGSMVHEYGKDPLTRTGSSKLKSTSRKVVKKMVELSLNKPGIRKLHKAEEHPENFMSKMKGAADKLMEAKLEITSRSGELHEFVEACGIVLTDGLRTENNQCNTDISVWNYIQEDRWRSPATSLHSKMVAKLPEAISCSTLDAKSTQWILCALQKGTLSQHIEALTQDTDMSDTYYNPEAAIRDRDLMAKVVRVLSPLGTLSFPFESIASLLNLDATNVAIDVSAVCAEYIFEYERYIPLNGWNKSLLLEHPPWTTLNGLACEKESDLLPDSTWYWQDAWTACSEGWQYGRTFHDQFHGAKKPFDTVRKRRWVRHRKQFESVLQARDAQHEVLEEMSPIQEPLGIDDDAPQFSNGSSCMECDQDITRLGLGLSYRRHHCRNCGKSFCEQCVRYRIEVPLRQYHGTGPQRVCISCYDTIAERKVVPDRFNMADFFVIKEKRIQAYIKSYASNAFTLHVSVGRDHTWTVQRTDDEFSQLYQHLLSKRDEQIAHGLFHIDLVNFKELDDVPSLSVRVFYMYHL